VVRGGIRLPEHSRHPHPHLHHGALIRIFCVLGALLLAGRASAHQDTVAHSRMVIHANGDVEYALRIPVEDLAEVLGRQGHTTLNAPEVRGAEELLFRHFQPLLGMSSAGAPCPVERTGIDVPEDERLYGELSFLFRCPAGAPVTLDYRVFFDVDPGHMGMLEVETPGGKTRAELIRERPRWEVQSTGAGPPQIRAVEGAAARPAARPQIAEPAPRVDEARAVQPDPPPVSDAGEVANTARPPRGNGLLIAVVLAIAGAAAFQAIRTARRRPAPPPR
jgi:hypothetical protein